MTSASVAQALTRATPKFCVTGNAPSTIKTSHRLHSQGAGGDLGSNPLEGECFDVPVTS
jgi:hypothetical protein